MNEQVEQSKFLPTEAFIKDLSAFQSDCTNVAKNGYNPHFKAHYTDLSDLTEAIRPLLKKHNLAIVQIPMLQDNVVTVQTLMTHISGGYISGNTSAVVSRTDPQAIGSAITYLRRYSLAPFCFIAGEIDDDAETTQSRQAPQQKAPPKQKAASKPAEVNEEILEGHMNDILNASTMDELLSIWKSIPKEYHTGCERVKNQVKELLTRVA